MAGIFKAYDIRGIYGETLTPDLAFRIGRAFATFLAPRKVVIGRDMRPHSQPLFEELSRGLTLHGVDVVDIGVVSTPMCYHATGLLGVDGSIMITASHNPGEWNGFKLCRENAIPISGATGIQEIERIAMSGAFAPSAATPGRISSYDILPPYRRHILQFADIQRPLKVCIDFANAMGIVEAKVFEDILPADRLFDTLDGSFPNHEANPLDPHTFADLSARMRGGGYDFGCAFDGDADRVGFTDENGDIVSMDIITALIAASILEKEKGVVFYDLRSSWAVKEVIAENGGTPRMSRVGHAFIKQQMRDAGAIFAGELSGHYYFRENYSTESTALAVLQIANLLSKTGRKLSELVKPVRRYFASGEINSEVADPGAVFPRLRQAFPGGRVIELDGLSIEFDTWWFNVRMSNTEPLCRLNLEAATRDEMLARRDEVLALIRS